MQRAININLTIVQFSNDFDVIEIKYENGIQSGGEFHKKEINDESFITHCSAVCSTVFLEEFFLPSS